MSANVNLSNDGPVLVLSQTSANLNLGSFGPVQGLGKSTPELDQTEPQQPYQRSVGESPPPLD